MKNLVITVLLIFLFQSFFAAANPIPADKLFRNPALSHVVFSPKSTFLAGLTIDERGRFLSLINIKDSKYTNVLEIEKNQSINAFTWLDEHHLYLQYSVGSTRDLHAILEIIDAKGEITSQFIKLDFDGGLVSELNHSGEVLFSYKAQNHKYLELHKLTIQQLKEQRFTSSTLFDIGLKRVNRFFFDETKRTLFALKLDEDDKTANFYYRPLDSRRWKSLFSLSSKKETFIPQHMIDDDSMYVLSNQNTDKVTLQKFHIKTQSLTESIYEHPRFDLIGSDFDEDNQLVSVSFFENCQLSTRYFDEQSSNKQTRLNSSFPGKRIQITQTSKTGRYDALYVFASDDPGTRYLYDNQTNKATLLSKLLPDLEEYQLNKTEAISVTSDAGILVESYLTLPQASVANGVLLVMPHGGPVGIRDYDGFNPESQYFSSRGFAVLRVNFRGSQGYGKAFLQSGVGQFGLDIEKDITAAVDHVRSKYRFERSCAIGASYGGYSSLMLAIKHPAQYQCAVGAYGVYDLPLLFNSSNIKATKEYRKMMANAVGEYRAELKETSPVYLASQLNQPILLIAGKDDMTAEFEHSRRLEYVLKNLGKAPKTLYYSDTGHGHSLWGWQQHETISTAEFLRETLGLEEYFTSIKGNKDLKTALAEDYATLGDGWYSGGKLSKNQSLAMEYYLKAANLGHGRASYLLGADHFDQGAKESSIPWFEEAAKAGYSTASYMLGNMYATGDTVETLPKKSFAYFKQADEQGHAATARLKMADALCQGSGVEQDINVCIDLLNLSSIKSKPQYVQKNKVTPESEKLQTQVMATILSKTDFSGTQAQALQDVILSETHTKLFPFEIAEVFSGLFEDDATKHKGETKLRLELSTGVRFGTTFEINIRDDNGSIGIAYNWTHRNERGEETPLYNNIFTGIDGEWYASYQLSAQDELRGTFVLTLRDMADKVILVREFSPLIQDSQGLGSP
jgi:pimeloyl-ACP methyl ester carboxylesterase